MGKGSDETSRIFCGHVNFPVMNGGGGGQSVYGEQNRIIIKRGVSCH